MTEIEFKKQQGTLFDMSERRGRPTVGYDAFRLGEWIVERDLNRLRSGNESVHISSLAMDLLTYLARPPGRVVSADELVQKLWSGRIVSDNPVYKIIAKLRRALRDDVEKPRYIETVRTRGYRLIAPVSSVDTGVSGPSSLDRRVLTVIK